MKLARKLAITLLLGISIVLATSAFLRARKEIGVLEADMEHDHHAMVRGVGAAVAEVWRSDGEERSMRLVEGVNERESQLLIRWVWLEAAPGDPHASSLPDQLLRGVRAGREVTGRVSTPDGEMLVTCAPVEIAGVEHGAIEISESLDGERAFVARTVANTALATGILAVLCGAVTLGLGVVLIGRPLRRLMEQARRIGDGDLTARIELHQNDEIGALAQEMNAMGERLAKAQAELTAAATAKLEAQEQLRHADRLATVGKLASGVAHELGAPLQIISGRARLIAGSPSAGADAVANAQIIHQQAQRVTKIIRQLLDFARRRSSQRVAADVRGILRGVLDLWAPLAAKQRIEIRAEEQLEGKNADAARAEVDPEQLSQVLANLVMNGMQAMHDGGALDLRLRTEHVTPPADHGGPPAEYLCLEVEDQGEGIRPENLPHVFEPFFTTKAIGEGTGLGLSVAYGIVRDHGGWIAVQSSPGTGSRFSIYLPELTAT